MTPGTLGEDTMGMYKQERIIIIRFKMPASSKFHDFSRVQPGIGPHFTVYNIIQLFGLIGGVKFVSYIYI